MMKMIQHWFTYHFLKLCLYAIAVGLISGFVKNCVFNSPTVHTYEVTDYAGYTEIVKATHCRADGVAMRFQLPDGTRLWLIDVSSVKELK
jgi:hypothetical protein